MFQTNSHLEIPPTAGLPLTFKDLVSTRPDAFAQHLAEFLDVPAVGVECSGTACLVIILHTLHRLSSRNTVIIPAYTCPLVVWAIVQSRLQIRICDIQPDSVALDPHALAKLCDSDTLAIIPTHLGGRVVNVEPVMTLARQCGAYVIEDAAQSLGARDQGRSVGLRGDVSFFSLAAGKGLSIFEGGFWISANEDLRMELAKTSRDLVQRRLGWETLRCLQLLGYAALYRPRTLRYIYGNAVRRALRRQNPAEAAGDYFSSRIPIHRVSTWRLSVGARALRRVGDFQQTLTRMAAVRGPRLMAVPGLTFLQDPPGTTGTWPLFMIHLPNEHLRDRVLNSLWGAGVGVARMFAYALPDYDYLRPWVGTSAVPNARRFAACSLTISNSPWLDDHRFEFILQTLSEHCREATSAGDRR